MPNEFLLQAAQAYIMHPVIQTTYNSRRGGVGTVKAITIEHPMLAAQAITSTENLNEFDLKSLEIHCKVCSNCFMVLKWIDTHY